MALKIVVLDADTLGGVEYFDRFKEFGELVVYPVTSPDQTAERVKDANIVLTNKVVINAKVLGSANSLKLICVLATGTNNIDFEATERHGVVVKNVAGYSTESVAQHTFSCLFYLIGQLRYYDEYVKSGKYAESPIFTHLARPYFELSGKKLGIIGLGNIGKRVAEIAEVFGMEVSYWSSSDEVRSTKFEKLALEELLKKSDVVSIHAPLNERTYRLIGEKELRLMKPSAILLNMGRGGIVDEGALSQGIEQETIAGAVLDVLENEPIDSKNPLLSVSKKERLLITPHVAWASVEAREKLLELTACNIRENLDGLS